MSASGWIGVDLDGLDRDSLPVAPFEDMFVRRLMAFEAERSSVGDVVPKFWKVGPRLNVIGVHVAAPRAAHDAGVPIANKNGLAPRSIFACGHVPFPNGTDSAAPVAIRVAAFRRPAAVIACASGEFMRFARANSEILTAHLTHFYNRYPLKFLLAISAAKDVLDSGDMGRGLQKPRPALVTSYLWHRIFYRETSVYINTNPERCEAI